MTQEEKQLLLIDLCARLPHGVKVETYWEFEDKKKKTFPVATLTAEMLKFYIGDESYKFNTHYLPFLRPMSSMTEEECITLSKLTPYETDAWNCIKTPIPLYVANIEQFDFFHRHHLDWRGLIPMGLALEAPEGMYNLNK